MKNICFVSNFEKTVFFLKISKKFNKKNVFWICVNLKEFNYVNKFYEESQILYLKKKNLLNNRSDTKLKINEMLYADRSLSVKNEIDKNFLINSEKLIIDFIKSNNINYIFGEFTWAHEILINKICNNKPELNCKHYNPGAVRVIPDRFLFFENFDNSKYFLRKNNPTKEFKINTNYYKEFIKSHVDRKKFLNFIFLFQKFFNLFYNDYLDSNDPRKISKLKRITGFVSKYFNIVYYTFLKKKEITEFENKNFVIYYMQKKPEANTDVKGIYYSNHTNNIENIWKILPPDFYLLVKQHPACTADNSLFFYSNIKKLRNVQLLNDTSDNNFKKIKPFATFSINSTASIETALNEIPSFTFANCFFNQLKFSKKINLEDLKNYNLFELIQLVDKENINKKNILDIDFLKSTYVGYMYGDHLLDDENINKLVDAIYDVIS